MKTKKIITICSSASFYKDALDVAERLKRIGYKVKLPKTANIMKRSGNLNVDYYKTWYKNDNDYHKKKKLMDEHFKKVIESDAILVVNNEKKGVKGYIGGNVLMEMTVAYREKKPIYLWNDIDSNSPFEEEIKGMGSIILNKDLSGINLRGR
jgi:hypothetical protein